MLGFTPSLLHFGHAKPLPEQLMLRAGPLSIVYENGDLRYIRLSKYEILRSIYAAVRDQNWGTVPGQLSDMQIDVQADSFRIQYRSDHRAGPIDFGWTGTITGTAEGIIMFEFEGEARSTFQRNRIGFCVLHPMDCAGKACTVEYVDGNQTQGCFPEYVEPHQPFKNLAAISHDVIPGVRAEVRFEGDVFEMEDQRNWTDASYKTYCTPLELPFPVTVEKGTRIQQKVTVKLVGSPPQVASGATSTATLTLGDASGVSLPRLGLGTASHDEPLSDNAIARLKTLSLDHLRVDLSLDDKPGAETRLRRTTADAAAIDASLHIALRLSREPDADLAWLRAVVDKVNPPVSVWLVFCQDEKSTSAQSVRTARQVLSDYAPGAIFAAGTDAFFAELNRERPPVEALDQITFTINPQVHAFDNASLVETLAAQAVVAASAHQFSDGKPLMVSPVTFHMRWNPNATGTESLTPSGELPRQVDVRQMSLFGAGWTLGSIKYLAESDLASVTYYETTGWLGVMERESGSPQPDKFHSIPDGVFPMYHVLADVGEFAGAEIISCTASDPLTFEGLALRLRNRLRVLLASFTAEHQTVLLEGLSGQVTIKTLDVTNAEHAMRDPAAFRAEVGTSVTAGADGLTLDLAPYAIVRLDQTIE